jgi:hypothetical protein
VAQLGGVHLACEQASNVLTKVLERGRLMSLPRAVDALPRLRPAPEQRALPLLPRPGSCSIRAFGARYVGEMDRMFDTYAELLPTLVEWLAKKFPKTPDDTDFVYRQAIRAKALDAVRGLLPASALSNLGIYASGQAYEALLLRMRAHPLPEVREYAQMMLDELVKVIPSFLKRVEVPSGAWRGPTTWPHQEGDRQPWCAPTTRPVEAEPDRAVRWWPSIPRARRRVLEAIVLRQLERCRTS